MALEHVALIPHKTPIYDLSTAESGQEGFNPMEIFSILTNIWKGGRM